MQRTVLITGASGGIGSYLTRAWRDRYRLTLTDIVAPETDPGAPFVHAQLADYDAVAALCQGVDTVVHLGADPSMQATWESLLPNNLIAVRNVFEAAAQAGCRRVVFASSINAVYGYPAELQVHTNMPVRPLNLYGASKVWGEAVACYYADQRNLSAVCLRYGGVLQPDDPRVRPDSPFLDIVITCRDLEQLTRAAVDAPDTLRFGIYHGVSDNRHKRLDITDARRDLGYTPEDDAFALAARNAQSDAPPPA
jgi:uronate dehydrogenase